jgi:hypothetical protein
MPLKKISHDIEHYESRRGAPGRFWGNHYDVVGHAGLAVLSLSRGGVASDYPTSVRSAGNEYLHWRIPCFVVDKKHRRRCGNGGFEGRS